MRLLVAAVAGAAVGAGAALLFVRSPEIRTITVSGPAERPTESPPPPAAATPTLQAGDAAKREVEALEDAVVDLHRRLEAALADAARLRAAAAAGPGGVKTASTADLIDAASRIRSRLQDMLLTVPTTVADRYAPLLAREDTGTARLLPRGKYEHVIEKRGGGAYYSFATRDNSYDKEPDVELQQGRYSSSFYGGTWGHVMDLGSITVESVPDDPSVLPPGLAEERRPAWEVLWKDAGTTARDFSSEFRTEANRVGLVDNSVPALVGHTYVVRAILPGEHDHLVAFSPVEQDEHGHTLVWRILKKWMVPSRR